MLGYARLQDVYKNKDVFVCPTWFFSEVSISPQESAQSLNPSGHYRPKILAVCAFVLLKL